MSAGVQGFLDFFVIDSRHQKSQFFKGSIESSQPMNWVNKKRLSAVRIEPKNPIKSSH